jgi:hypothetical protein
VQVIDCRLELLRSTLHANRQLGGPGPAAAAPPPSDDARVEEPGRGRVLVMPSYFYTRCWSAERFIGDDGRPCEVGGPAFPPAPSLPTAGPARWGGPPALPPAPSLPTARMEL